ncbi:MAG: cysteine hydrolase [Gammaproteobacteria bacterium]|nr:cysteine hydrolase [Gammaproteobacteria bacterium]
MPRRALVVIDVQNEYVTGNLAIEFPDVRRSLSNISKAMDAADAAAIPIVVVQHTSPTGSPAFARGTAGWELHDIVNARPRTHYIEKKLPSAFVGTDLAEWIGTHRIDTLVVVGYMTQHCDDSTVKHAVHAGLAVELLADATGSLSYANRAGTASAEEIHRVLTVVMQSSFAAVMRTEEWITAIRTGKAPERDNILESNRRARAVTSI